LFVALARLLDAATAEPASRIKPSQSAQER